MRRSLVALLASGALMALLVGPVAAGGVNPAQLSKAGWSCFDVPNLGVHCSPPGVSPIGSHNATPLLYFFNTTDPNETDTDFSGTEQILTAETYNGQPCPQEGIEVWTNLGPLGFACHHK